MIKELLLQYFFFLKKQNSSFCSSGCRLEKKSGLLRCCQAVVGEWPETQQQEVFNTHVDSCVQRAEAAGRCSKHVFYGSYLAQSYEVQFSESPRFLTDKIVCKQI